MSTAKPMDTGRRVAAYVKQHGLHLTPRQIRQIHRMAIREAVREAAQKPSAGPPPS